MKCVYDKRLEELSRSRPARGAWVEILSLRLVISLFLPSRPARGAWVEIDLQRRLQRAGESRPARGAWVEMMVWVRSSTRMGRAPQGARGLKSTGGTVEAITAAVAPRKGRVG